ncbi:hypothetical protein [Methylobacterium iners]|uniref:Uncharacterized protein n=1 Tax=Methylobacterium iners TaxID=418707 RepID=A0ABQ4S1R8_9HYPH|nr:hypothetical protein [Methylobacterium iners]GJD95670.1 hypothetical protein OCOJLMKI_2884 [Methylobacterium iners]
MKTSMVLAGLALLLAAAPASAQGSSAERAACTPDVFRLCASHIPSVGQITACLKRERASLSAGCRTVMDNADKATTKVATRSLAAPKSPWCRFDRNDPAADSWRTWCGDNAWSD